MLVSRGYIKLYFTYLLVPRDTSSQRSQPDGDGAASAVSLHVASAGACGRRRIADVGRRRGGTDGRRRKYEIDDLRCLVEEALLGRMTVKTSANFSRPLCQLFEAVTVCSRMR